MKINIEDEVKKALELLPKASDYKYDRIRFVIQKSTSINQVSISPRGPISDYAELEFIKKRHTNGDIGWEFFGAELAIADD